MIQSEIVRVRQLILRDSAKSPVLQQYSDTGEGICVSLHDGPSALWRAAALCLCTTFPRRPPLMLLLWVTKTFHSLSAADFLGPGAGASLCRYTQTPWAWKGHFSRSPYWHGCWAKKANSSVRSASDSVWA